MNRKLAYIYLRILKKPTKGLDTINYITSEDISHYLNKYTNIQVIDIAKLHKDRLIEKISFKLKVNKFIAKIIVNMLYYTREYFFIKAKVINMVIIKENK